MRSPVLFTNPARLALPALLAAAALWNLAGGALALADPAAHFRDFHAHALDLGDPVARFFYRCTWINVMAWGLAYALAAWRPALRMPVLAAGAVGKLAYAAAALGMPGGIAATAWIDVAFAAAFLAALRGPAGTARAAQAAGGWLSR